MSWETIAEYWETKEGKEYFGKCSKVFCDTFRTETKAIDHYLSIQREDRIRGAVSFAYNNLENVKTALFSLAIQGIIPCIYYKRMPGKSVYSQYYARERNGAYRISFFLYSENVNGLCDLLSPIPSV